MVNKWFMSNPKLVEITNVTNLRNEVNKKVSTCVSDESSVKAAKRKAVLAQCIMNGAIILIGISIGMPIGYSAILLPQLRAENSTLRPDEDWASWIASVHSIMTPIGSILAGPMMDCWGRKVTLQISVLPMMSGWLLMTFAPNLIILCVGRMLAGFAVGMGVGPSYVLIGEISEPRLRGLFSSAESAAYSLGILFVYTLGSVMTWRLVAASATSLPFFASLLFFFLPESPVFLVRRNRIEEATAALIWLKGGNILQAHSELQTLLVHTKTEDPEEAAEEEDCISGSWSSLALPEVYKPFLIILTFCSLQILSGSYIVIFYGVSLIAKASGGREMDLDSLAIAVMTALVRFVVSIVTSLCLLKIGRRRVGIVSGVGTTLACLSIVVFLEVKKDLGVKHETVIIGCLLMIYVALNTFGIFALPTMMIAEVLPARVRGFVSGILLTLINLMIFSTTKLYPYVECVLSSTGVFSIFGVIAFVITVYVYLFLPETKHRPLTQIETYFACGKNFLWQTRDKTLIARKKTSPT